ncbi:3-coathanger stack domain-containing protein [Psychroserpens sp.]|uniref:3-coathanger stack domain-containing protein n=1 Tax=Psychroserpens sp. TaxID=2020870 RepID=UPI00385B8AF9
MKNLYILIIIICFSFVKANAQRDIIFWLDNSTSISTTEWNDMTTSLNQIITDALDCNPNNRIAIVHYAGGGPILPGGNPWIYIEDPNNDGAFTNNLTEAITFPRRMTGGDYAHESLALIGDALDAIPNSRIISPQTQLNHIATQNLVVYLFTDTSRGLLTTHPSYPTSSNLVSIDNPEMNSDLAFQNYTDFKNNRNATIIVTSIALSNSANNLLVRNAKAAISSYNISGNYNGTIENYPAEPDNNQLPRMYLESNGFDLDANDINIIASDLCNCPITLTLSSPLDDVNSNTTENRQADETIFATNFIDVDANAIYHAGNFVELNPGFEAESQSRFAAYVEACSDDFLYRNQTTDSKYLNDKEDIDDDLKINDDFRIIPNPSSNFTKLESIYSEFNRIKIISVFGEVEFYKVIKASKSFNVDVSNFPKGVYIVSISLVDGNVLIKKLVKN